ncbi:monovalent cation/H+ antiporter complex subunit F [Gordonia sp. PP30]|uniref:monovalent cation/H+ antiporter complex subunit F n=1 Tax=unclassified Gordonia (in: high G+C Gram-positive bacteria) TaxID=2657482 RepID=UPI001FFF4F04|nr:MULTISPECIES: monovalent cation/H+ antiporter complex subunit F [unclassified Gordonia (in: high G+C Gram-positive bacteria)]UQE74801.1 monovalent cation/H+ antiporter complex subunit F [Gordonia sp. PP30]
MNVVWAISGAMLSVAIVLTLFRSLRGPTTLDRLVGIDTLVAMVICSLAVWVAATGDTTIVPAIVALSLVSFIGSISVARFRVRDDE